MMLSTKDFFELAQLAEASYANFTVPAENYDEALEDKDFSTTQADLFLVDWQLVPGAHQPNTASGFSSTLFRSADPGGGYVLAFRGTDWAPDYRDLLSTNIGDIVGDGLATKQIVDMYNEWQRINAASGAAYSAARLAYLTAESAAYADATLKLSSADPAVRALAQSAIDAFKARTDIVFDGLAAYTIEFASSTSLFSDARATGLGLATDIAARGITVTGHSLGGHLAMAFTRLFPTSGVAALTVNGAGYPTGSTPSLGGMAPTNIDNLFGLLGGASDFDTSRIVNVYGEDMPEFVTMNQTWGLVQPGHHQPIFIEQDTLLGNALGHGASQMTDSLAVYGLFIQLDDSLQNGAPATVLAKLNPLFEAASNDTAFSLEAIVGALGRLFTGNGLIAQDDRESLYGLISAIKQTTLYRQSEGLLAIQLLTEFDGATLAAKAQADTADGLAYRYALANLVPFAITGDASLFASHNANGELDRYDPATGSGALTDQYLKDRAAMLSWKIKYDIGAEDADDDPLGVLSRDNKPYSEDWDSWTIKEDWDFIDHSVIVSGTPLKIEIDGVDLTTTANHQIVFGSSDAETLTGGELKDNLYGSGGNDTLVGSKGNDYLEGGTGYDTYVFNAGDGYDTVRDTDGLGVIKFGAVEALGSAGIDAAKWIHVLGSNTWADTQNGITYIKRIVDGEIRLTIKHGGNTVVVRGWQENELGITLGEGAPSAPPPTSLTLTGDLAPLDTDPQAEGVQPTYNDLGNVVVTTETQPNRWDNIQDSSGNDHIRGLGGRDFVMAWRGGDDIIEGGADAGDLGGDALYGGTGQDHLFGGDQAGDLAAYILAAETQPGTGMQGDFLGGGPGDDTLVGDSGNDLLVGGVGVI